MGKGKIGEEVVKGAQRIFCMSTGHIRSKYVKPPDNNISAENLHAANHSAATTNLVIIGYSC